VNGREAYGGTYDVADVLMDRCATYNTHSHVNIKTTRR